MFLKKDREIEEWLVSTKLDRSSFCSVWFNKIWFLIENVSSKIRLRIDTNNICQRTNHLMNVVVL